ncbi:larval cuticle protein 16/17-like [Manduca sexta]|uniref:larval cuticle protein 16/17-like n=1 Tax=Manduca sexta TaxID=7130 RepID=UPI00188F39A9|nr:larval cuticle protein 16/17-like [Manduca sexta]
MNKFVLFVTLLFASSVLTAPNPLRFLPALKHEHIQDEFGQYALRYVTAEGTIVSENGKLIANADGTGHVMVVDGEVTYVGDDGKKYITKYTAGVDGVKFEGDHLPVAPAVPAEIVAADAALSTGAPAKAEAVTDASPSVDVVVSTAAPVSSDASPVIPEAPAVPPMIETASA